MWRYEMFLPLLLPVVAVLRYVPGTISRGLNLRALAITFAIWLGASIGFAIFLWFGVPSGFSSNTGAMGFASVLITLTVVQMVPIAVALVILFILIRIGARIWLSIVIAAIGSSATIFALPLLSLMAACAFIDRSCI